MPPPSSGGIAISALLMILNLEVDKKHNMLNTFIYYELEKLVFRSFKIFKR